MNNHQITPLEVLPTPIQKEWISRERSIFFHFGINTFTDKEWGDGTEDLSCFNPLTLDCRQWIRIIKQAGFTAAILTAKHHDGFCLWPSKYTDFSIKNTPYKDGNGDIVKEFVDACNDYGIKPGFYISPWDRNSKLWGTPAYDEYYLNQLEELLSNYGKIYECWWDSAGSESTSYDFTKWRNLIKKLQPECIIFGSGKASPYTDCRWTGNENGFAENPCWSTVCNENLLKGNPDGTIFKPAEADVSMRPGWFYHDYQDKYSKTPEQLLYIWFNSCGKNATLLLNISPTKEGLICDIDAKNILEFGNLMKRSFAVNLAYDAIITSSSTNKHYSPYNMLIDDHSVFYVANEENITPEITFTLPCKKSINCFKLSENLDYGYRIRKYKVFACIENQRKLIFQGESVGFCSAEYFDPIETDEIILCIEEAIASPIITTFGIYHLERMPQNSLTKYEDSNDLAQTGTISVEDNTIYINLGGIFAYNTIIFDSTGIEEFELYTYNGARWDFEMRRSPSSAKEICHIIDTTWSYQLKLVITKGSYSGNQVEVYYKSKS